MVQLFKVWVRLQIKEAQMSASVNGPQALKFLKAC